MIKRFYREHKETVDNIFWRSTQVLFRQGVSFLVLFIAARSLLPPDFGLFNYLAAVVTLLMIFCDFGISTATSKYVAEYVATGSGQVNRIQFSACLLVSGIVAAISLFVIIFGKAIFKSSYIYILLFLPYLLFSSLSSVLDGVYRGFKKFRVLSLISFITGSVALCISYYLIKKYLLLGVILAQDISSLLTVVCLFAAAGKAELRLEPHVAKKIMRYSFVIGLSSVAFFMYTKVDILILKQFGYLVEIGYYGIVDTFFNILIMPALILGTVIAPNIVKYMSDRSYDVVLKKFNKYFLLIVPGGIVLAAVLFTLLPVFFRIVLPKYYTSEFLSILKILLVLLPFKLWGVFCVNGFIVPGGYARIVTLTTFIGGILNIAFDYILISLMGFIGVFFGTLLVHSLLIIATVALFYKEIKKLAPEAA